MTLRSPRAWIEKSKLSVADAEEAVQQILGRGKKAKAVLESIQRVSERTGDPFPASVLVNAFVNNDLTSGANGPALASFLTRHGIDASHVRQSGEDWVVVFNPDLIQKIEKLTPKDVDAPGFAWDLPKVARTAGLLEPPPRMVKEITEWVQGRVCDHLIGYNSWVEGLGDLASAYATGASPKRSEKRGFPLDLRGWKYLRDAHRFRGRLIEAVEAGIAAGEIPYSIANLLAQVAGKGPHDTVKSPEKARKLLPKLRAMDAEDLASAIIGGSVTVVLNVDSSQRGSSTGGSSYSGYGHTIILNALSFEPQWDPQRVKEQFSDFMAHLHEVVGHELTHDTQKFLAKIHDLPRGTAGRPSRSEHSYTGTDRVVLHMLNDAEFYTRLRDEVGKFLRMVNSWNLEPKDHEDFRERKRKAWVGAMRRGRTRKPDSDFFSVLKEYAPTKYKKAVGEFWKATEPPRAAAAQRVAARFMV